MPQGKLYVKLPSSSTWIDTYERYGLSLEENALSKLMTPAPSKEFVENKSDLQHGKRVNRNTSSTKKDERNVSLIVQITAPDKDTFLTRYGLFCTEILDKGFFDLKTPYVPNTVYRMTYLDCTQFSEFMQQIGKFTLSLNEPDPTNRGATDKWVNE